MCCRISTGSRSCSWCRTKLRYRSILHLSLGFKLISLYSKINLKLICLFFIISRFIFTARNVQTIKLICHSMSSRSHCYIVLGFVYKIPFPNLRHDPLRDLPEPLRPCSWNVSITRSIITIYWWLGLIWAKMTLLSSYYFIFLSIGEFDPDVFTYTLSETLNKFIRAPRCTRLW